MPKKLPLTIYPDPLLKKKSAKISKEYVQSAEFAELLLDMKKTMEENNGVGLAAVQVGKPIALAIVNTKDGIVPLINPVITFRSIKKEEGQEGCLSIPGVFGQVKRSTKIRVKAWNLDAQPVKMKAEGYLARVMQHEIDHINGTLFIDRTKKFDEGKEILAQMNAKRKKA